MQVVAIFMLAIMETNSATAHGVVSDGLKCIFTCSAFGCQENVRRRALLVDCMCMCMHACMRV